MVSDAPKLLHFYNIEQFFFNNLEKMTTFANIKNI